MTEDIADQADDLATFELPDDIVDIDDYTENITMLIYGDPGIGKTRFAGTARTLILAVENGTIAAKKSGGDSKVWKCPKWENVVEAYEWLLDNASKPGFPFDWVCIDTGTQMQLQIRRDIVDADAEVDDSRNPDKVELQEYGEEQQRLMRYVTLINDLPVNVLWTAHAMLATNEEGEEFRLPQFHGKGYQVANWIAAQMHCVGYMHFAQVKTKAGTRSARVIQWRGTDSVRAKDRFDALGARTVGKGLSDIQKIIESSNSVDPQ
ncbi:Sak4-like ssDNA annealing protein [Gordonia phage Pleakley]|uniref:RecA-like DNA recombinase n=1 Tax=Gordonia phage Pleakley TaxID=2283246 RepID=A0A345M6J2_9CAUD|nr:Sak4-like ssDNA annealing protein [Gordonia phage Pleakley]AXH49799.1 RecA-like DNA recombinase [Gordonia phage Fury]AXH66113.1 RecA-like DNA recombinase [Gordonia phage Pleakley]